MSNITQPQNIRIENVSLNFGNTEVLKGVNLDIEAGEFFAFLGPSGSGKSTLLRAIAGFGPTPGGRILIGDQDVTHLPPWKRKVGMVFQNYALWPHMTVRKNVAFGLEQMKVSSKEIMTRVDGALDLVGLRHLAERRPSELSGGQQQRIALARTIIVEPKVLLLDEPLSNLDANLRVQMRRDILNLQRELGLTTIFVTHDQEEANTTADRLAVLNEGVIQQIGDPVSLYDHPNNRFVAEFLGTANIIDGDFKKTVSGYEFISGNGLCLSNVPKHNGKGCLVFRPQNTRLQKDADTAISGIQMKGKVVYSEFLGSQVRYGVDVSGHLVSVDQIHYPGNQVIEAGGCLNLMVSSENAMVVPA